MHVNSSFLFQKILGGLIINIFCENWQAASFYIKEQTGKKIKFEFQKLLFWTPEKRIFGF